MWVVHLVRHLIWRNRFEGGCERAFKVLLAAVERGDCIEDDERLLAGELPRVHFDESSDLS